MDKLCKHSWKQVQLHLQFRRRVYLYPQLRRAAPIHLDPKGWLRSTHSSEGRISSSHNSRGWIDSNNISWGGLSFIYSSMGWIGSVCGSAERFSSGHNSWEGFNLIFTLGGKFSLIHSSWGGLTPPVAWREGLAPQTDAGADSAAQTGSGQVPAP